MIYNKKIFYIFLLISSFFLLGCQKNDISNYNLDNTYWVSSINPETVSYIPALSFNNGYIQFLDIDKNTGLVHARRFTASYKVDLSQNKIFFWYFRDYEQKDQQKGEMDYKEGRIIYGSDSYYLK